MKNQDEYDDQEDIEHSNAVIAWMLVAILLAGVCLIGYEAYRVGLFDGLISFLQNLFQ